MNHLATATLTALSMTATTLASEGWALTPIELGVESDASASYWTKFDDGWDHANETDDATAMAGLPISSQASVWAGEASASTGASLQGDLDENGFSLAADSWSDAYGYTSWDASHTSSSWSSCISQVELRLDRDATLQLIGGVYADGMGTVGIAGVWIRRADDGAGVRSWESDFGPIDIDETIDLAAGTYTIGVSTSGGAYGGDEWMSDSASWESAWLVAAVEAEALAGDFNGDGRVDGADLGQMFSAWGTDDPEYDLDGDGVVDGADIGLLMANWS